MTGLHETAGDRRRERAVAAALARELGAPLIAAPTRSRIDYLVAPRGAVEIKGRLSQAPYDYGGWLFLNDDKRDALLGACRDGPAIHAWHFPPMVYYLDVTTLPDDSQPVTAGRPDERDDRGARPAHRIHIRHMRRLLVATWEESTP